MSSIKHSKKKQEQPYHQFDSMTTIILNRYNILGGNQSISYSVTFVATRKYSKTIVSEE